MWGRALDGFWLVLLAIYVVAGTRDVPFHGDESTLIAMSRDYYSLVQTHNLDQVLYQPDPDDPMMQELRILNGTVGKMAMGLAWDVSGYTVDHLNKPWLWGAGWDYNVTHGHMPEEGVLYAARLSSALLLALSAWSVFALGWFAGGRPAAWAASLIYATTPQVLLNGRRAMMEGSHLAFSALTVLAALVIVRLQDRLLRGDELQYGCYGGPGCCQQASRRGSGGCCVCHCGRSAALCGVAALAGSTAWESCAAGRCGGAGGVSVSQSRVVV